MARVGPGSARAPTTRPMAVLVLIVVMALIEVVLLAGPAFAVGARRQQRSLALMSAAGGTPVQSRRVIIGGAIVLGGVAALVGVVLGIGVARALLAAVQSRSGSYLGPFDMPWLHLARRRRVRPAQRVPRRASCRRTWPRARTWSRCSPGVAATGSLDEVAGARAGAAWARASPGRSSAPWVERRDHHRGQRHPGRARHDPADPVGARRPGRGRRSTAARAAVRRPRRRPAPHPHRPGRRGGGGHRRRRRGARGRPAPRTRQRTGRPTARRSRAASAWLTKYDRPLSARTPCALRCRGPCRTARSPSRSASADGADWVEGHSPRADRPTFCSPAQDRRSGRASWSPTARCPVGLVGIDADRSVARRMHGQRRRRGVRLPPASVRPLLSVSGSPGTPTTSRPARRPARHVDDGRGAVRHGGRQVDRPPGRGQHCHRRGRGRPAGDRGPGGHRDEITKDQEAKINEALGGISLTAASTSSAATRPRTRP